MHQAHPVDGLADRRHRAHIAQTESLYNTHVVCHHDGAAGFRFAACAIGRSRSIRASAAACRSRRVADLQEPHRAT